LEGYWHPLLHPASTHAAGHVHGRKQCPGCTADSATKRMTFCTNK
jgi:hypothetical protein